MELTKHANFNKDLETVGLNVNQSMNIHKRRKRKQSDTSNKKQSEDEAAIPIIEQNASGKGEIEIPNHIRK